MASTRRTHYQLDIYHDPAGVSVPVLPSSSFHDFSQDQDQDPVEAALLSALGPLNNSTSSRQNIILNPSVSSCNPASPLKHSSSPAGPLGKRALNKIYIPPPQQPNFTTDSPAKRGLFFSNMNKENMYPYDQSPATSGYAYKAPAKRVLADKTNMTNNSNSSSNGNGNGSSKKAKPQDHGDFVLPEPDEMPAVHDDGKKPQSSYATMIGMAILRAPNRRLTLAQIYKWISDNFTHYRAAETGWQNSIRHNLSLNKAFIKQERPKDDPGKGNYWAIEPGMERQFCKDDRPLKKVQVPLPMQAQVQTDAVPLQTLPSNAPRSTTTTTNTTITTTTTPAIGRFALGPNTSTNTSTSTIKNSDNKAVDSAQFPQDHQEHFSSDGTIPASDPALQDDEQHANPNAMPPPASRAMRSSPPPQDIGSSPPPMTDTPPRAARLRFPSQTHSGGARKRKFVQPQDSGYYSSIESSAVRNPGVAHQVLTSDADPQNHRRIKRGRAEEEIARIRSSSYDSPTKGKQQTHKRKPSVHFEYTSPQRPASSSAHHQMAPPLTPAAVVFKRPAKPPQSVSPNTNLRNHRNRIRALLGESPAKCWTPLAPFSPAFNLDEFSPAKNMTPWRDGYDVFEDSAAAADDLSARGSPEKKRPRMERAVTTTGVLADITNGMRTAVPAASLDSPFNFNFSPFKPTPGNQLRSPVMLGSPLKRSFTAAVPSTGVSENGATAPDWLDLSLDNYFPQANQDIFGLGLHGDGFEEEGLDILQEFGKIGAQKQPQLQPTTATTTSQQINGSGSPVKRPQRPSMGRSVTSRF